MDGADVEVLARRLQRERIARREAEGIAERVTAELYLASQQLQNTNGELQTLNETLRDFVAMASHDLRGPLTSVVGMTALLRRRWDDLTTIQRSECLDSLDRQGHVLVRLVDDLLTVSRLEAGGLETAAEIVGVRLAVQAVIDDLPGSNVFVEESLTDVEAYVDPEHLRRMLSNYLGNALRYGAPPFRVTARDVGAWVEILVCDEGSGVPAELLPRLFGKFARGPDSRALGGTGLGLSIVQGLARANGGDAWYEPNLPSGSSFGVRLRKAAA